MRLLILTQKIDSNDDLLGFFHGWVAEFAKHCEKIIVVALGVGEYNLPENVRVLSLGKESMRKAQNSCECAHANFYSRHWYNIRKLALYVFNFYRYIWFERKNYDAVLVHMNREYMLLGGLFWRWWNKKTALWYNHAKGNIFSVLAGRLARIIFYTSPLSFFAKWPKARKMPAGVDAEFFKKENAAERPRNSILFLGRLAPVKNLYILIEAANLLDEEGADFILDVVGEPGAKDKEYFEKIRESARDLEQKGKIKFLGKAPNRQTPAIYNQRKIFVNLTGSGSFDKTILEAMACETLALVSNRSYEKILPPELFLNEKDSRNLADKLLEIMNMPEPKARILGQKLRQYVVENHSLNLLVKKLTSIYEDCFSQTEL